MPNETSHWSPYEDDERHIMLTEPQNKVMMQQSTRRTAQTCVGAQHDGLFGVAGEGEQASTLAALAPKHGLTGIERSHGMADLP